MRVPEIAASTSCPGAALHALCGESPPQFIEEKLCGAMVNAFWKSEPSTGLQESRCVEDQTSHAAQVKAHALGSLYKTKEHVLTNGASRHDAGTLHVYMRLGKALYCAAVGTLFLCSCNIHGKYVAQLTCGSVTVKVVVVTRTHFRSPLGPKRSVLILSGLLPIAVRSLDAVSTNDVGPQT
jgi:hypothetical protein